MLTDVVMPEMNGRALAEAATQRVPSLKVVYMTGYTSNAIVHNGVLDPGTHLVSKPFTIGQLAGRTRRCVGRADPGDERKPMRRSLIGDLAESFSATPPWLTPSRGQHVRGS